MIELRLINFGVQDDGQPTYRVAHVSPKIRPDSFNFFEFDHHRVKCIGTMTSEGSPFFSLTLHLPLERPLLLLVNLLPEPDHLLAQCVQM